MPEWDPKTIYQIRPYGRAIDAINNAHAVRESFEKIKSEVLDVSFDLYDLINKLHGEGKLKEIVLSTYNLSSWYLEERLRKVIKDKKIRTLVVHGEKKLKELRPASEECPAKNDTSEEVTCTSESCKEGEKGLCGAFHRQRLKRANTRKKAYEVGKAGTGLENTRRRLLEVTYKLKELGVKEADDEDTDKEEEEEASEVKRRINFLTNLRNELRKKLDDPNYVSRRTTQKFPPTFDLRYISTPQGTHHSKFALLYCEDGLRVVVTTANLCPSRTNDMAWTQFFPKKKEGEEEKLGEFGAVLQDYLYLRLTKKNADIMDPFPKLTNYDFTSAAVKLIVSVPGFHPSNGPQLFGFNKLKKEINAHYEKLGDTDKEKLTQSEIIMQPTSIGQGLDLTYLDRHVFLSLLPDGFAVDKEKIHIVWPSVKELGYLEEGSEADLVLKRRNALFLTFEFFGRMGWENQCCFSQLQTRGWRRHLTPHHKLYYAIHDDGGGKIELPWLLMTSACMSKGAMGEPEVEVKITKTKKGQVKCESKFFPSTGGGGGKLEEYIDEKKKARYHVREREGFRFRNFEMGVMFLPSEEKKTFTVNEDYDNAEKEGFPIPFKAKPRRYVWEGEANPEIPFCNDPGNERKYCMPWDGIGLGKRKRGWGDDEKGGKKKKQRMEEGRRKPLSAQLTVEYLMKLYAEDEENDPISLNIDDVA